MNLSLWQSRRLARVLRQAASIPLYRDLWAEHGVDVSRLDLPADLAQLPVLTKQRLLAVGTCARLNPARRNHPLTRSLTSGSTGEPLELLLDPGSRRQRQRRFLRALLAAGYRPGQAVMLVSSRSAQSIKRVSPWARLARWTYADLYLGVDALLATFAQSRPQVLYAPLSALIQLGEALARSPCQHRPGVLISTSEQLSGSARRQLQTTFGAAVTDFYGLTEAGLVAFQCPGSRSYRIVPDSVLTEFLPASTGLQGLERLVITDLHPTAMPLIRYDTGDLVRREPGPLAAIVGIAGKQLDFLRLPDGQCISPYEVDRVLGELPGLRGYRVLQQTDLSLEISAVFADPDTAHQATLGMQALCRGLLPIQIRALDALEQSGHKVRPVRSLAKPSA